MSGKVKLTKEQQEAIEEVDRHLQIIACAGSGKTEVITRRIAYILKTKQNIKPENIVAFTFTNKAAASMKQRIEKALESEEAYDLSQMYIGTIHSFCYHLLTEFTEAFKDFKILDTVKNHLYVNRYYKEIGMSELGLALYPRNVKLYLDCIAKMIDDYENKDAWSASQRCVLQQYMDSLYRHKYLDFTLMIFETLQQIKNNDSVKAYLSQIKYLVVDEYQDVNDMQEQLIMAIRDAGANICVVGDDDQTIYQFRGSNADNMITFFERYDNVHQVKLVTNFRCSSAIVDVADTVISHNERRISKKMVSGIMDTHGEIKAMQYFGKEAEFDAIARKIRNIHDAGVPYHEIAVLVRKRKIIASLVAALDYINIPFETDSAEHFFGNNYYERFVKTLRILTNLDKAALYECWKDVVEGKAFNVGFRYIRSCARNSNMTLCEIIQGFCEKIEFLNETVEDYEERLFALEGILTILKDYDEIYGDWQFTARLNGGLDFLEKQATEEYKYHNFKPKDTNTDAVQIMTVHKAKGLEFHTVFLPELMEREFPAGNIAGQEYWHVLGGVFEEQKDRYQGGIEDERKLFYVAVTRAKENLYMSYDLTTKPISRFVLEAAMSDYLETSWLKPIFARNMDGTSSGNNVLHGIDALKNRLDWIENMSYKDKRNKWENDDYYGTGAQFFPAMYTMLENSKEASVEDEDDDYEDEYEDE